MLLQLNFESEIPIYAQINHQIIEGIAKGHLVPGQRLPSVRQMAEDLGINLHTVNKAYNILKNEKLISIHRQKGVYVSDVTNEPTSQEYKNELVESIKPMVFKAYCKGMTQEDFKRILNDIFSELK
ncbi:MAG: GntR family transcriptional regulator [Clostridia bacterium]|nr:GntR family transcriptional regulator [Clostridia bacterium]